MIIIITIIKPSTHSEHREARPFRTFGKGRGLQFGTFIIVQMKSLDYSAGNSPKICSLDGTNCRPLACFQWNRIFQWLTQTFSSGENRANKETADITNKRHFILSIWASVNKAVQDYRANRPTYHSLGFHHKKRSQARLSIPLGAAVIPKCETLQGYLLKRKRTP